MVDHLQQLSRSGPRALVGLALLVVTTLLPGLAVVALTAQNASADGGAWHIVTGFYHNTFQVGLDVTCDDQGFCQGTNGPWQITMRFSGSSVAVSGSNGSVTVSGNGQTNAPWPDSTYASGNDTMLLGGSPDTESWQATRTSAPSTPVPNPPSNPPTTPPETNSAAPNPPPTETGNPGPPPSPSQTGGPAPPGGGEFAAGVTLPSDLQQDPPVFPNVRTIAGGGTQTIIVGTGVLHNAGAKFATDSRTSAHIEFADGTTIDMGPSSRLTIGADGSPTWGWFDEGILHFSGSNFERPYFRMRCFDQWCGGAVKGTDFTADYSGSGGALVLRVNRGRVDLAGPRSLQTVRIDAGRAAEVDASGIKAVGGFVYPWWSLPDERLMLAALLTLLVAIGVAGVLLRRRSVGLVRALALPAAGALFLLLGGVAASIYSSALGGSSSAAAAGSPIAIQSATPPPTLQPATPVPTPSPTPVPTPPPTPRPIDARSIVIASADLRAGYAVVRSGGVDCPACTFISNYELSYHHPDLQRDLISGAIVAANADDAHANYAAMITKYHSNAASSVGLGDESYAYSELFDYAGIRFLIVIWRSGAVVNFIDLAVPDGALTLQDAVELAKVQQQHVVAETGP